MLYEKSQVFNPVAQPEMSGLGSNWIFLSSSYFLVIFIISIQCTGKCIMLKIKRDRGHGPHGL